MIKNDLQNERKINISIVYLKKIPYIFTVKFRKKINERKISFYTEEHVLN